MKMFNTIIRLSLISLLSIPVNAGVLTFDDITTGGYSIIYDGYGGLNWDNISVLKDTYLPDTGYENGRVSGDYVAFNAYASVGTVSSASFDFLGAYLTAAWSDSLDIVVRGYDAGVEIYAESVQVGTDQPTWFGFNFLDVDQLSFTSTSNTGGEAHFAMDNFTYQFVADRILASSIPEPEMLTLFLLGLTSLAWSRRRQMR